MNKFFRHYLFILLPVLSLLAVSCGEDEDPILVPDITAVDPIEGLPGVPVTITGRNLANATAVRFGAVDAVVTNNTATSITTTVPASAIAGAQDITIVTAGGSDKIAFTVLAPLEAATITAVDPLFGGVGTPITITGTNFVDVSSLMIGDTEITDFDVNAAGDAITFVVPEGADLETFTGRFTVVTPVGSVMSPEDMVFTFGEPATITAVDPLAGGVGTEVTLVGTNFFGATSLMIGETEIADFVVNDAGDAITFTVPEGATAETFTGPFTVVTPIGTVVGPDDVVFTFEEVAEPATITAVRPIIGGVGTVVTISGANFTGATALRIGTTDITGFEVSDAGDAITFTVPETATADNFTGRFTVVTPDGEFMSAEDIVFTFGEPARLIELSFEGSADDASGNNNTATLVGAGATFVDALVGQGLQLADGAYATLPNGILSGLDNTMTISSYVKLGASAGWTRLWDFGTGTDAYAFLAVPAGLTDEVRFAIKNGGAEEVIDPATTGAGTLTVGEWYHIAVVIENGVGILYLNGEEIGRNENMTITPADLGETTQNYIGKAQFAADPLLNGVVDEFRIYDLALTPQQIGELASALPAL